MSLVVAIKKDGVVYMGADTRTTRGEHVQSFLSEGDLKIRRVGSCLIGGAGLSANYQLMANHSEWFALGEKPLTKRYLVTHVIPRYYNLVKSQEKLEEAEQGCGGPECGCSFLVTDGGRLFMIENDFEVVELSLYGQIGCTENMAKSLFLTAAATASPNELILKALRISAYRNDGVGAPFVLINTRERQFEYVEE